MRLIARAMTAKRTARLTKANYEALAELRHTLRGFLRFSEAAAKAAGVPPEQHQALLAIKGFPGRDIITIGELAERLHVQHHSAVGLVDRLVRRQLVRRVRDGADRRRVHVELSARGETLIGRLSAAHLDELRQIGPLLRQLLDTM